MASSSSSRGLVLLLITSGFFITGLLFDYMPMIVDDFIKRNLELATNEEIIGFWSKPPVDLHSYYWLYDIVNAEQFQTAGEKAQLRQVGPFHFVSRMEKRIVDLSPNKFRLTYNSTRFTRLNESYSSDLLDEPLRLLNPVYVSIIEGVRVSSLEMDGQGRAVAVGSVSKLLERYNETLVHNVSARVALLGKPVPIIAKLRKIAETFGMGDRLPDLLAGGKFGYAALTNNTWQGPYEIYTGYQETARSLGDLISYKGKRRLDYFEGKCNRLQVSAGELRPMPLDPDKILEFFSPNFCRVAHLRPTSQVKLREGQAINYAVSPDDLASAQVNPDNRCYCTNTTIEDDHCSLNGVVDLAPCSYNAPILLSLSSIPLDAKIINSLNSDFDPELLRGDVEQLAQADERAQFVILKRVGVPIKADLTVTLLMKVMRNPTFKQTANVPEVSYIPLATIRESVTIPPKLGQLVVNLESFLSLTYHIKVVMYLTAIVLLCWLTGHYYCRTSSQVDDERRGGTGSGGGGTPNGNPALNGAQRRQSTMTSGSIGGPTSNGGGGGDNNPFGVPLAINSNNSPSEQARHQQDSRTSGSSGGGRPPRLGEPAGAEAPTSGRFRRGTIQGQQQQQLRTVEERILQAAQTNDCISSERANSADSSRSLPPSRQASRLGSLENGAAAAASGETSSVVQEQPKGAQVAQVAPQLQRPTGVARMFSRVDTELRERRVEKELASGGGGDMASKQAAAAVGRLIEADAAVDQVEGNEIQGEESGTREGNDEGRRRHRKGWFMNVYSRFVGLLSGIRNTIQLDGVNQLEVGNSGGGSGTSARLDQQDRQLEMLAGKIDNWYSSSAAAAELSENGELQAANGSAASETRPIAPAASASLPLTSDSLATAAAADAKRPGGVSRAAAAAVAATSEADTKLSADDESRAVHFSPLAEVVVAGEPVLNPLNNSGPGESGAPSGAVERNKSTLIEGGVATESAPSSEGRGGQNWPPAKVNENEEEMGAQKMALVAAKSRQKRSIGRNTKGSPQSGDETASLVASASEEEEDGGLEDEEELVDEMGEAELRQRDEADKVTTLRQIEAVLGESGKETVVSSTSGEQQEVAEMASQAATISSGGESKRKITMINSSTSIDSAINSTALNGSGGGGEDDNSTASSLDSRVTQVAAAAATAASGTKVAAGDAPTAVAVLDSGELASELAAGQPNQSAGENDDDGTTAKTADSIGMARGAEKGAGQIDESSEAPDGQRQQSNKWPASERPDGAINGRAIGAGGGGGGGDLPHERVSDEGDRGAIVGDNEQASKLDARNGISGTNGQAEAAAASSLAESAAEDCGDKMAPLDAQLTSGDKITSAIQQQQPIGQASSKLLLANPFYSQQATGQLNGLVAAGGQPINVGASPTSGAHEGWQASAQRHQRPTSDNLLRLPDKRGMQQQQRAASPNASRRGGNNITPALTFQQQQRIGSSRGGGEQTNGGGGGGGNNILNEKIISHQAGQQGQLGSSVVGSAVGFNSNRRGANETTGNHHHQRVQPAGA